MTFSQKLEEEKKNKCFKCGAADYTKCPCDNLKKYREQNNFNKEEHKDGSDSGKSHLMMSDGDKEYAWRSCRNIPKNANAYLAFM